MKLNERKLTNMEINQKNTVHKLSAVGLLVALGIIYGDIGTSPLYVMKAIIGKEVVTKQIVFGAISCVFWTLTFQTTFKYVILILRADNNGVGGIFALYSLIRKHAKWAIVPAVIGASALLADGIITPPISVSASIEGLIPYFPHLHVELTVIIIITGLFMLQSLGTAVVGKSFGPIMTIWFLMLGVFGAYWTSKHPAILQSINPLYAYQLLIEHPGGFWLLGAVFLCTTGAEALYSDLSHCGRQNIQISWIFVKSMLLLQYMGQGAWLMSHLEGKPLDEHNPIFDMMPDSFRLIGIGIATLAAIIASQALITGSFTLVHEAIRLQMWPKVRVNNTNDHHKDQLYIPSVNWLLMFGCIGVVLYFKESKYMEAAYGLAITLCMLMTTILMTIYLYIKHYKMRSVIGFMLLFTLIEVSFLFANLKKFPEGGWVSLLIACSIAFVMVVWLRATTIKNLGAKLVKIKDYVNDIMETKMDHILSKYTTVLIYLTKTRNGDIESKVIESILKEKRKRANLYVFAHIENSDHPYEVRPEFETIVDNSIVKLTFHLGFRTQVLLSARIDYVLRDAIKNGKLEIDLSGESKHLIGDAVDDSRFVLFERFMSNTSRLGFFDQIVMNTYFWIKNSIPQEDEWFGIDKDSVKFEKIALNIQQEDPCENMKVEYIDRIPDIFFPKNEVEGQENISEEVNSSKVVE